MFVLHQTAKAVEQNSDPLVGMALFVAAIVSVAFLIYAVIMCIKEKW